MNSLSHYNVVHKFILMPQVMKIPDAKAAVERGKLEKIPASQLTKVGNKNEVIAEAIASLMDLCRLQNSELESQFQKYKGRAVLRGDIVKYDSGSCAVLPSKDHQHHTQTNSTTPKIKYEETRRVTPHQTRTPKTKPRFQRSTTILI